MTKKENHREVRVEKILKFGGSSVASPENIKLVINIIQEAHRRSDLAVVVSAFGGVTDQLIQLGRMAAKRNQEYKDLLEKIIERHKTAIHQLIKLPLLSEVLEIFNQMSSELSNHLQGVFLIKELSSKSLDSIMSFGERFSAFIISKAISQAVFLDAREVIKTDSAFGNAQVDFKETNNRIKNFFSNNKITIATGYIGSSKENETTTLGRGGSDYTAAILGAALDVKEIEIWTDVDGVMTADPRKEPYAFSISEMSYKEAMEMSYFGAKIIHPPTIIPALEKNIPLLIKNTFNPVEAGTRICVNPSKIDAQICGISSIDQVALLNIEGSGMVGVCGISKRLFGALAETNINIILISQGSSEHSICIAVSPKHAQLAKEAIEKEFFLEMQAHIIDAITVETDLSVIAVVGVNMCKTTGISGKLFGALGKNGINVVAITQGSSELNITLVVNKKDEIKAIRVIHEAFFLSPKKTLNIFLVGVGLIGKTLLQQIKNHLPELEKEHLLDIRLVGLADSKRMIFDGKGIPLNDWRKTLDQSENNMDIMNFKNQMEVLNVTNPVFVDCTSSQFVTDAYDSILNANISIVTPNKKATSGKYEKYKHLKEIIKKKPVKFLYGTNVGAGLPIISSINELVRCGDKILKIEAILSGTLSYLFNTFSEGKQFSEVVQEAQKKGFTEPDPREDLKGMDVARKLLILSRESNYPIEMESIIVEKFLPEECFNTDSLENFYSELKKADDKLNEIRSKAQREGKALRFIAKFEKGQGLVSLQSVSQEHPFYHLCGSDNIAALYSEFYRENPLVIKGQGAGAKVTAGRVFADIIRLGLNHGL